MESSVKGQSVVKEGAQVGTSAAFWGLNRNPFTSLGKMCEVKMESMIEELQHIHISQVWLFQLTEKLNQKQNSSNIPLGVMSLYQTFTF